MREEKVISEREAIRRERRAFTQGASWELAAWQKEMRVNYSTGNDSIAEAQKRYPLPKRVVPRVVRFENGNDVQTVAKHVGSTGGLFTVTRCGATVLSCGNILALRHEISSLNDVRLLADLLAHPTEEIDDDGSDRE